MWTPWQTRRVAGMFFGGAHECAVLARCAWHAGVGQPTPQARGPSSWRAQLAAAEQ